MDQYLLGRQLQQDYIKRVLIYIKSGIILNTAVIGKYCKIVLRT